VFLGKRSASTSTSDLTAEGIRQLVDGAMALVNVTEEDAFSGCRRRRSSARFRAISISTTKMCIRCRDRSGLSGRGELKRRRLRLTRASPTPTAAALTRPPDARRWRTRAALWATTARAMRGFRWRRWLRMRMAPCSATVGGRARGGWRIWIRLRLLARRRAACASPAGSAAGSHAAGSNCLCAGGGAVAHRVSLRGGFGRLDLARGFIFGRKAGRTDCRAELTIIDDNTMLLPTGMGGFGTSPFDGEGLPSQRTVVVDAGVLRNYLLNTYTARKRE